MQRYLPTGAVRVVSASTNSPPLGEVVEDDDEYDEDDMTEDGAMDDLGLGSEAGSDVSSPLSLRVARFLDTGKPNGPRKRKRAKLNHLSGEQKVERRKILNRIAAQTARDRKKVQMDDLERFVKELASENMRLARENADLRQKSTDLEVENVKLRTHLGGRSGTSQSQQVASGNTTSNQIVSAVKPTVVAVRTECVSKPVGIAARVIEPIVREAVQKAEEQSQVQLQIKAENETQPEVKRARLNVAESGRATSDGVCDAAQRNAAAVCASTQQQYSFARRARALFSVLYALLLVSLRGAPLGLSAPTERVAQQSSRVAARPAPGSKRPHESRAGPDPGGPAPAASGGGSKLERLGALVARRIARSAPLREAYWKLRRSGTLTPQTVAWMRQRLSMSARLAALRSVSTALHLRTVAASKRSNSSLDADLRAL